jgi:glycosyltransferase involved in cell wall biosynthesis
MIPHEPRTEHISICLCTFKRPELLKGLLGHLSRQRAGGLFSLSASVVDNDPELSGKPVIDEFSAGGAFDITYTAAPDRNLALLRNISVQHSRGDYVAFIDDDEYPDDDWLLLLLKAVREYRVDGALGPVVPQFLSTPPEWIVRGKLCERIRLPTGTRLRPGQTRTGNALLRRSLFLDPGNLFDLKCRLGGEDDTLFQKLMGRGHEFVWCDEAIVHEQIPAERLTLDYFSRRSRLIGYMTYEYPRDSRSRLGDLLVFGKSCLAAGIFGVLMPFVRIAGYHRYAKLAIRYEFHKAVLLTHLGRLKIDRREI